MNLESFLPRTRSLFCVFCRNMNSNVLVELELSRRMFGLLLQLIAIWRLLSMRTCSGATYFTGSTSFRLKFLHCENDEKTFPCWSSISLIVTQRKRERAFRR